MRHFGINTMLVTFFLKKNAAAFIAASHIGPTAPRCDVLRSAEMAGQGTEVHYLLQMKQVCSGNLGMCQMLAKSRVTQSMQCFMHSTWKSFSGVRLLPDPEARAILKLCCVCGPLCKVQNGCQGYNLLHRLDILLHRWSVSPSSAHEPIVLQSSRYQRLELEEAPTLAPIEILC